jgi:hypothetical protein
LGTGVKKAYLIGGEEKGGKKAESTSTSSAPSWNPALRPNKDEKKKAHVHVEPVRAFSIEWAGL